LDEANNYIFGESIQDFGSTESEQVDFKFRHKHEHLLDMTKQGLIELYKRMKNREPGNGKWETKLNEDNLKLFIKL